MRHPRVHSVGSVYVRSFHVSVCVSPCLIEWVWVFFFLCVLLCVWFLWFVVFFVCWFFLGSFFFFFCVFFFFFECFFFFFLLVFVLGSDRRPVKLLFVNGFSFSSSRTPDLSNFYPRHRLRLLMCRGCRLGRAPPLFFSSLLFELSFSFSFLITCPPRLLRALGPVVIFFPRSAISSAGSLCGQDSHDVYTHAHTI